MHIGYLLNGDVVLCVECFEFVDKSKLDSYAKLYKVNVKPYSQHCDTCDIEMVKGSVGFPDLYIGHLKLMSKR